jgi:hypothetical protein
MFVHEVGVRRVRPVRDELEDVGAMQKVEILHARADPIPLHHLVRHRRNPRDEHVVAAGREDALAQRAIQDFLMHVRGRAVGEDRHVFP